MALVLAAGVANAQDDVPEDKKQLPLWLENVYLGGSIGATTVLSDVQQYDLFPVTSDRNEVGFGGGGYLGYRFNASYSLEAGFYGYGMNGVNRENKEWFTGGGFEPSLILKANLSNLFLTGSSGERKFNIHAYGGIGIYYFRSRRYFFGKGDADVDPLIQTFGFKNDGETTLDRTREISIPFGMQFSYDVSKNMSIFLDQRINMVNTDKLDAKIFGNTPVEFLTYTAVGVNFNLSDKKWIRPESDLRDKLSKVDSILDGFNDADNDGVMDTYDKDNKTPEGAKTTGDGMAMDTDGDGVADYVDQERLSLCTEVDENGVALDNDGDGVPNCKDKEPNSEAGVQVDINGKAISTGLAAAPTEGGNSGADVGLPSVYFELNSNSINYTNYPALTEVAKFLKKNKDAKLTVVGHTDATGSEDYNKKLGKQRAQAVIDHLVKIYGIDASRLSAESEGSNSALAVGKKARANRRVDFLYTK